MKKLMQLVAAVKAVASLAFTALIMVATVASMIFGKDSIPIGYIWQAIFLALIYGIIQLVAFSENYFKQMKTLGRMAILGVSMFVALAVFAIIFQWFPMQKLVYWLIFAGLYSTVFLVAVFTLRTVFRLSGIKYNQMLAAYKARPDRG